MRLWRASILSCSMALNHATGQAERAAIQGSIVVDMYTSVGSGINNPTVEI